MAWDQRSQCGVAAETQQHVARAEHLRATWVGQDGVLSCNAQYPHFTLTERELGKRAIGEFRAVRDAELHHAVAALQRQTLPQIQIRERHPLLELLDDGR